MLTSPPSTFLLVDIAMFAGAMLLVVLFLKRHEDLKTQGFNRGSLLVFAGVTLAALSALVHLLAGIATDGDLAQTLSDWYALPLGLATVLIFSGLAVIVNRVIPKSSKHLSELVAIREELAASNDELAKTIANRNQELEINNLTLRQILEDQQVSRVALLQSEKKFRTLFDESPAIFATISPLHTITDINLYGAKILGYDTIALVGRSLSKIVSLEDADKQQEFIDLCFDAPQHKHQTELRFIKNDTGKLWVKVSGSVIHEKDVEDYLLLVCQDITESKKLAESLSYQAKHDDLTGLYNRRALETFLEDKIGSLSLISKPLALIYMDVDQLKVVNDTCGHIAGDEFIRQLVQVINQYSDRFSFFARIGGDEFALVLCDTSHEEAQDLAEVVRNATEDLTFRWEEQSFRQSISIGVAFTSRYIRSLRDILAAADAACFAAKQAGRNRVVIHEHTSEKFDPNRSEMLWVSRLQTALMRDRFELYFQPIVPLADRHGGYIHYEVLLRYVDDDGTHISPETFLPAAERFGLSNQIDLWVLTTTLDFLHRHPDHTQQLECCSINLSSHSLSNHQTRSAIRQLVLASDFPATKLCFEITETSAIHNLAEAIEFINELKILGCKFALDDFGTGFSSFSYLKNLDVDYIKIDGSFIRDILTDRLGRAMVKAMNSIGKELGIATVAEYVENLQISDELQQMEVAYGQGFGLAKPMPISKAREYYALSQRTPVNG